MSIYKIRYENFKRLLDEFQDKRTTKNERGLLLEFSQAVDISDRQLSHLRCGRRNIGSASARQIEKGLRLAEGYMDVEHGVTRPENPNEQHFIETALSLYRANPLATQQAMLDLLRGKYETTATKSTTSTTDGG
jgi:hypothetical protein